MDKVAQTKEILRKQQWISIINACQNSGISVANWCKQNNICMQTYYRNLKKYREEICESLPSVVEQEETNITFKKLEVSSPIPSYRPGVVIHWNGMDIDVNEGTSSQTVEAVLIALKSLC